METEAKLAFKDKDSLYGFAATDFFRGFCVDPDVPVPVLLENTYLDKADLDISRRGGMIRIRHYAGGGEDIYEFTVKYGGSVSVGMHQRYEWNLKNSNPDFSISDFIRSVPLEDDSRDVLPEVFGDIKDDDLTVICSNSFYRTVFELSYEGSIIEACFDSGIISSSDGLRTDEICELELELIKGDISNLRSLTDLVMNNAGCVPLEDTKYRRTLAMGMSE